MQIELNQKEVTQVLAGIDVWVKEPMSDALLQTMTLTMLSGIIGRSVTESEVENSKLAAEVMRRYREREIRGLKAKFIQAAASVEEHKVREENDQAVK